MMCLSCPKWDSEWQEIGISSICFLAVLFFVAFHFTNMICSSGWMHSFVHIITPMAQGDGRTSPTKWAEVNVAQRVASNERRESI